MKTFWELTRKQYENEGEHPKYLVRDAVGNTYLAKTRREIIEKAVQVARWLKNDRVKHVGVYLDSSTDWISAYLGIVISGNVAVLLVGGCRRKRLSAMSSGRTSRAWYMIPCRRR